MIRLLWRAFSREVMNPDLIPGRERDPYLIARHPESKVFFMQVVREGSGRPAQGMMDQFLSARRSCKDAGKRKERCG